jgi:hypothetical protein
MEIYECMNNWSASHTISEANLKVYVDQVLSKSCFNSLQCVVLRSTEICIGSILWPTTIDASIKIVFFLLFM